MKLNSTIIYVKLLTTPFAQLKYFLSVDLNVFLGYGEERSHMQWIEIRWIHVPRTCTPI